MKTTSDGTASAIQFTEPCTPSPSRTSLEGKEWLYEVKFDGYCCIAGKSQNGVTLWLRRGNDFTSQFPHIARACERLPILC